MAHCSCPNLRGWEKRGEIVREREWRSGWVRRYDVLGWTDKHEVSQRILRSDTKWLLVGAILCLIGCVLPWYTAGDFGVSRPSGLHIARHISIDPLKRLIPFTIHDRGGLMILALCGLSVWFAISPPQIIKEIRRIRYLAGSGIIALALLHMTEIVLEASRFDWVFWAPRISWGLPIIILGALIVLDATRRSSRLIPET